MMVRQDAGTPGRHTYLTKVTQTFTLSDQTVGIIPDNRKCDTGEFQPRYAHEDTLQAPIQS